MIELAFDIASLTSKVSQNGVNPPVKGFDTVGRGQIDVLGIGRPGADCIAAIPSKS